MPTLKTNPTLTDLQKHIRDLEEERGFTNETVLEKCLFLGEEVGELFQAIREKESSQDNGDIGNSNIQDDLSDVLTFLCAIANRYDVSLEEAFREKQNKFKAE